MNDFLSVLELEHAELHHSATMADLLIALNSVIVHGIAEAVSPAVIQDVNRMEGRAKVRYFVGWAVYK